MVIRPASLFSWSIVPFNGKLRQSVCFCLWLCGVQELCGRFWWPFSYGSRALSSPVFSSAGKYVSFVRTLLSRIIYSTSALYIYKVEVVDKKFRQPKLSECNYTLRAVAVSILFFSSEKPSYFQKCRKFLFLLTNPLFFIEFVQTLLV